MRRTFRWLAALLAAGLTGCASLPFHPARNVDLTPEALNLAYEDLYLDTADGERINAWYIPAPGGGAGEGKTLLFFHGNAGNLSHRLESIALFHRLGLAVCIIDYRGFGNSSGSPSVGGTALDAEAAWNWLRDCKGLAPDDIVIFGRSLGGGVAAELASRHAPAGLILESTFTSLYDVGKDMFPWLPVSLFLPQDYDTGARLKRVRSPVLFVHSPDDEVVPRKLGRSLYEGHGGPKQWLEIRGSHNSGYRDSGGLYLEGLARFLASLGAAP